MSGRRTPIFLAHGFRVFFLAAGLFAVLAMLGWAAWLALHAAGGQVSQTSALFPAPLGHAHEMLFGYAAAVIAGFLLTAAANWAEAPPIAGRPLAFLALVWLAGRLVQAFGAGLPTVLAQIIDLAFLPALALAVGLTLWRSKARRNLILVAVLAVLFAADLLVHLEIAGMADGTASAGLTLAVDGIVLLMVVLGGRVTPSFTANALRSQGIAAPVRTSRLIDGPAIAAVFLLLVVDLAAPGSALAPWLAAIAAILQLVRLAGWQSRRTLGQPILWVLHLGYLWIAVGLALKAAAGLGGPIPASAATHALTVGAIGTYTLGMMSRISLGHTARPLLVRPGIAAAYGLVSLAALLRIAGPALAPDFYFEAVIAAAGLWITAFAAFIVIYWPILTGPRADGKPG